MWQNPDASGVIQRTDRVPDTIPGVSRFHESVLHQGRIEKFFIDTIRDHASIEVERGVLPEELELDSRKAEDADAHPIRIKLRHLSEEEATPAQNTSNIPDGLFRSSLAQDDTDDILKRSKYKQNVSEIVYAKYVIGCDGAHSWTRRQLGFQMDGEQTDFIWGVLDIIPITDFRECHQPQCVVALLNGT